MQIDVAQVNRCAKNQDQSHSPACRKVLGARRSAAPGRIRLSTEPRTVERSRRWDRPCARAPCPRDRAGTTAEVDLELSRYLTAAAGLLPRRVLVHTGFKSQHRSAAIRRSVNARYSGESSGALIRARLTNHSSKSSAFSPTASSSWANSSRDNFLTVTARITSSLNLPQFSARGIRCHNPSGTRSGLSLIGGGT